MEFRLDKVIGDLPSLLMGVPLTLALTVASFLLGTAMALPLALARIGRLPALAPLAVGWVEFFRTTPPLVHVVWAYYALPVLLDIRIDAFTVVAGALAFSVSAQMAEIFRAGILAVPAGQTDAARVLGLSPFTRLFEIVLPQALRLMLAPGCNTLVTTLKQSSLAAVIALPELMNRGQVLSADTFRPLEVLTLVAAIYLVLTYPLVLLAAALERRSGAALRID
jgi:polar amino acid transport system permease protein